MSGLSARQGSEDDGGSPLDAKKRRIERGKKACLPCRSRKCRCGGAPPEPCTNCVDDQITCQWPTEDGRSSQARKDRARQRRLQAMMVRGLGRPQSKAERDGGAGGFGTPGASVSALPGFEAASVVCAAGPSTAAPTSAATTLSDTPFAMPDLDAFDPEQFILAMSSQLPTVEEGGELSPAQVKGPCSEPGRVVKITWWRPHGPTAIAPGLKRLSLKVRVEPPTPTAYPSPGRLLGLGADEMFGPDGMPTPPIMRHLLDVFSERLECVFPVLNRDALLRDFEAGTGSVFLFNCIAATAARFSIHPAIARPDLNPHEYGNVFAKRAKDLMPSMFAVPSRDTVMALTLMAHVGFGNDSESEEWMFTGMAVRMAIDLGLHLDQSDDDIGAEEQRLNCLAFWSVLLLDYALSFGVGRQTTFRIEEITQRLPTNEDIRPGSCTTRSPFPLAARQMLAYGPLVNLLNGPIDDPVEVEQEIAACRAAAVAEYNALPEDMTWSATNLQLHRQAHQAPIYVHIHLWMHTVIASGYLTSRDLRQRGGGGGGRASAAASGHSTPVAGGGGAHIWRNSARTIGDVLVLSDVIDPHAYLALPFVNQALYVAGCCYIKEIEAASGGEVGMGEGKNESRQAELFRSMLASVATSSIATLQRGLARQATYWAGVAWVNGALAQRVAGIHADNVDLAQVTEQLQTYVSIPDPGLLGKHHMPEDTASGPLDFANLDLLTVPFDIAKLYPPSQDMLYL